MTLDEIALLLYYKQMPGGKTPECIIGDISLDKYSLLLYSLENHGLILKSSNEGSYFASRQLTEKGEAYLDILTRVNLPTRSDWKHNGIAERLT